MVHLRKSWPHILIYLGVDMFKACFLTCVSSSDFMILEKGFLENQFEFCSGFWKLAVMIFCVCVLARLQNNGIF